MTYALITLYNPTADIAENAKSVAVQVDKVFLCDNSNQDNSLLFAGLDKCKVEYVPYFQNLGLSGAFNRILQSEKYHFNDEDFLIFFDQDSNVKSGHVDGLVAQFCDLVEKGFNPGCLGPVYFNKSNGIVEIPRDKKLLLESNSNNEVKHTWEVKSIITSSMLTTYGRLKAINFFSERIFLDFVDWDVCWRFMDEGFLCCMTDAVTLLHAVGDGDKKIGLLRLRVGAAFRVYYQTRDSLYLLKEKYVPVKFRIRLLIRITVEALVHLIFLSNRERRLHYYFKGLKDYFCGIRGMLKE